MPLRTVLRGVLRWEGALAPVGAAVLLAGGVVAAAPASATVLQADEEEPAPPAEAAPPQGAGAEAAAEPAAFAPRYRDLEEARALLEDWASRHPARARVFVLASSYGGREVPALELGAAGEPPRAGRPTVLLVGGLDGVSLAGTEAVLTVCAAFLEGRQELPPGVALVAVPWGSPDGLASWVAGRGGDGRNARATDDDGDGRVDEDGPDDLDGDGQVLDLLVEDPAGEWVRGDDPRFLRPAQPGDAPRYRLRREGRDDDGDGSFNEDGPGGVVLDRSFPVGWRGPWEGHASGPWPLSEPLARALADLALERRTFAALVFQGSHGAAALPGGHPVGGRGLAAALPRPDDRPLLSTWARRFSETTRRVLPAPLRLAEAHGEPRPGAAVDWLYAGTGALALEVAAWGPQVGRPAEEGASDARYAASGAAAEAGQLLPGDAAWRSWLDDVHAGIGFVDWTPVELAPAEGRVGGWQPRTRVNPPEEELAAAVEGCAAFVAELAAARPELEIQTRDPVREGAVCRVRARLRNRGGLPTGLSGPGLHGRSGLVLALELSDGGRRLVGPSRVALPHLAPGGVSEELEWVLHLPEDGTVTLRAEDDWTTPVTEELRP